MLTFALAVLGYLFARTLWHAVRHYAALCGELPLVWFVKTLLLVSAFCAIVLALSFGLLYAFVGIIGR